MRHIRIPLPAVALIILILLCRAVASAGPLVVQCPQDWKLERKTNSINTLSGRYEFYSLMRQSGEGLLMFSPWPPGGSSNDIPALVKELADRFVKDARKSTSKVKLTSDTYHIEQFDGDQCHGSFVLFEDIAPPHSAAPSVLAMFFIYVDGRLWNGQFTGSRDGWDQALPVLKSLKTDN